MNIIIDYVCVAFKYYCQVCLALLPAAVVLLSLELNILQRKTYGVSREESKNSTLQGNASSSQYRPISNSKINIARFRVEPTSIGFINPSMLYLELRFPVLGTLIPSDHGYALFSALSRRIPAIHQTDEIFFDTLAGKIQKGRATWIKPDAKLKIRTSQAHLSSLLTLTYQQLKLEQYVIRLGLPEIATLKPASSLYARTVTIKNHQQPDTFLTAVQQKLEALEISCTPMIGKRRIVRIGGHRIVGFSLWLQHVSNEAALSLLRHGLGGRRHMGCGFFHAIRTISDHKAQASDLAETDFSPAT